MYTGRLDSAERMRRWAPTPLAETISILDYLDENDVDGTTNNSAAFSTAIDAAIDQGKALLVPELALPYVWGTAISEKAVAAGETLEIRGVGSPTINVTAASGRCFLFAAESIGTYSLASQVEQRDRAITLTDATGVQKGDVFFRRADLVQETGWGYPGYDVHQIAKVSGNDLTVRTPKGFEFQHTLLTDQEWVATGGEETFWYPSYFTAEAAIEVLINDVVQESEVVFAAHDGNSNNNGWDVTFITTAADKVVIRRVTQKTSVVYRGGQVVITNLSFVGETAAGVFRLAGFVRPFLQNLNYSRPDQFGTAFTISHCIQPVIRQSNFAGGFYAWLISAGTRGGRISDIIAYDTHHAVSLSFFASDIEVDTAHGELCDGVVDAHPAFDSIQRNISEDNGWLLINNRGEGGAIINYTATGVADHTTTHGIFWLDNGAVNSPKVTAPRNDRPYALTNISVPASCGFSFFSPNNITIKGLAGGFLITNNSSTQTRPLRIEVYESTLEYIYLRYAQFLGVYDTSLSYIDLYGSGGAIFDFELYRSVLSGTGPFIDSLRAADGLPRTATVVDSTFEYVPRDGEPETNDGKLAINWNTGFSTVTFDGCTFDGVNFADAAAANSVLFTYGGTTPNAYLNGSSSQE